MIETVNILRFNPKVNEKPYYQKYNYEYKEGMTVLDVLNYIYEKTDSTLNYSYGCRNGHCGICAVMVDGKAVLSCKKIALPKMTIEPLKNFRIIKDLVINREEYEKRLPKLRLFLERKHKAKMQPEKINMTIFEKFKVASRCVECLACVSVCPVYAKNQHLFLGPMGYVLEARHLYDQRDDLNREILLKSEGIELCKECGLCSEACIHKVDPAQIIKDIKEKFIKPHKTSVSCLET